MNLHKQNISSIKLLLIAFFGLATYLGFGQSYGLQFNAHENQLDQRTGLCLSADKEFKIKETFLLDFELAFIQEQKDHFGYILRIIANDTLNLDLLYDEAAQTVNLVEGNSSKIISVPITIKELNQFKYVSINFNRKEDLILLAIADSTYTLKTNTFKKSYNWQIYFGLNQSRLFKTTDVPGMKLRNINLLIDGNKQHRWPLNNQSGNWIKDETGNADAYVINPFWLYTLHNTWKLEQELNFDSYTQFVQKNNSDTIFFLSSDTLVTYPLSNHNKINYKSLLKETHVPNGSKLVYDNLNDEIICYSIDRKIYSRLNTHSLSSTVEIPKTSKLTAYWQHNSFFNPNDTSIIFIGGYGYLTYKNEINKVDLNTDKWTSFLPDNKIITPHYLSSLGTSINKDTLFILGGYGSISGDQKINPGYVYDLIRYLPETNSVEKIFTYENPAIEEFCLSNSMIINFKDSSFYVLAYSKYEYKNKLKLVKGSLNKPVLEVDDNVIEFNFHDIMSYVDIIYVPTLNKIYAITIFYNDKEITNAKIYSILAEPALRPANQYLKKISSFNKTNSQKLILFLVVLVVVILALLIWRKKLHSKNHNKPSKNIPSQQSLSNAQDDTDIALKETNASNQKEILNHEDVVLNTKNNYAISLFGGFQVICNSGNNITNKFTPLLKELFLLVFLKSLGESNNGISSTKLKEILWYDKSEKDARNNHAVNIARLKNILGEIGDISLSKTTGYWLIEINDSLIKTDYTSYLHITQLSHRTKEQILDLIHIIKRGDFLHNVNYEWLDKYKAEVSASIIDVLMNFANEHKNDCDPSFLIQIAETVMIFDSVNEDALIIKCNSLIKDGKHSIAKKTYDIFSKEYQTLYGEPYSLEFCEIIEN